MIYSTYIPSPPLNGFVHSLFYFEGFNLAHNVDRFLPDGNTEMIIDLTEEPKYIYDNRSLKKIQACNHAWVSGVRTQPITIPSGNEHRMLVINFIKGRAFPFYPVPLSELKDCVVDADLIFGDEIKFLRESLLEAGSAEAMFPIVQDFLIRQAKDQLHENITAKCLAYSTNRIIEQAHDLQLKQLAEKIGYSHKHFISIFKKNVGVSPKVFLKIMRFQKAIRAIEESPSPDWARICYSSGYYDQSHFINEFKKFSEFTPSEYMLKKSDQLNYVPIH